MYKLYAKPDKNNVVKGLYLDLFEEPQAGDVAVESFEGEYDISIHINRELQDAEGCYHYKVENGKLVERTMEEKVRDEKPKTKMETIQETVDMLVVTMLGGDTNV